MKWVGLLLIGLTFIPNALAHSSNNETKVPSAVVHCSPDVTNELQAHTFRIKILDVVIRLDNGSTEKRRIIQTGFRVKDYPGVFTALHGLVFASGTIRATLNSEISRSVGNNTMMIAEIDRSHDLVRLMPTKQDEQWEGDGTEGFTLHKEFNDIRGIFCTAGYPYARTLAIDAHTIRAKQTLDSLIGRTKAMEHFYRTLEKVKSPAHDLEVLDVRGAIVIGHSGSPLLDHTNRIVGVANGSLVAGDTDYSWAVPLTSACFFTEERPCQDKNEIQIIADAYAEVDSDQKVLEQYLHSTPTWDPYGFGTKIKAKGGPGLHPLNEVTSIAILKNCSVDWNVQMRNLDRVLGFCMKPTIQISGKDSNVDLGEERQPFGRICLGSELEEKAVEILARPDIYEEVSKNLFDFDIREEYEDDRANCDKIKERRATESCHLVLGLNIDDEMTDQQKQELNDCVKPKLDTESCYPKERITDRTIQLPPELCRNEKGMPESMVYEILITHEPAKKADFLFDALDQLGDTLAILAKLAPILRQEETTSSFRIGDLIKRFFNLKKALQD